MFRTYYHDKFAAGTILSTVEEAGQYLLPQFLGRREETVYLVCLANKDKVIAANVVREDVYKRQLLTLRGVANYVRGKKCSITVALFP